jgi:hypothetical protein
MNNTFKNYTFDNILYRYSETTGVLLIEENKTIVRLTTPNEKRLFLLKLNNKIEELIN